jgi:hypothetical protein
VVGTPLEPVPRVEVIEGTPITKTDTWWELPQDERRRIFEASSRHVATGLDYLPAVARRLHHGRDLPARSWYPLREDARVGHEHDPAFLAGDGECSLARAGELERARPCGDCVA